MTTNTIDWKEQNASESIPRILIKHVRLFSNSLLEAGLINGEPATNSPSYRATVIIPKNDEKYKEIMDQIDAKCKYLIKQRFPSLSNKGIEDKLKRYKISVKEFFIRDGDSEDIKSSALKNHWLVSLKSNAANPPTVITADRKVIVRGSDIWKAWVYNGVVINVVATLYMPRNTNFEGIYGGVNIIQTVRLESPFSSVVPIDQMPKEDMSEEDDIDPEK